MTLGSEMSSELVQGREHDRYGAARSEDLIEMLRRFLSVPQTNQFALTASRYGVR